MIAPNRKKNLIDFLTRERLSFREKSSLLPYLSFKIGGTAEMAIEASSRKQLSSLLDYIHQHPLPLVLLGGGTNCAFCASHFSGLVVINRSKELKKTGSGRLYADSGVFTHHLISFARENGLGGLEFLAGIPGTIGGALVGNAGAFNRSIQEVVETADLFCPESGIRRVDPDFLEFRYRHSRLKKSGEFLLGITLQVHRRSPGDIQEEIQSHLQYRRRHHPAYQLPTAGCFFKNPVLRGKKVSAGKLIDEAGFKGRTQNFLEVSSRHANFIIHHGGADCRDLRKLEDEIVKKVKEIHSLTLEREVVFISPTGEKY